MQTTSRLTTPPVARETFARKKTHSAVRDTIRTREAGLASSSSNQFCTATSPDGINEISLAPPHPMALARPCPGPPSKFSTCFSYTRADNSPEVLTVALVVDPSRALSAYGPCLVGSIITLDDASFTAKIAIHSGANALAPFGCVALLDIGFPHGPSLGATCWIACSRWRSHPSRAKGNALLDPGVVLANLPLCKFRRESA